MEDFEITKAPEPLDELNDLAETLCPACGGPITKGMLDGIGCCDECYDKQILEAYR